MGGERGRKIFFGIGMEICEKHINEKSRKKSKTGEKNYVNTAKTAPHFLRKKGAVEKVVENVENSILPRGKPLFGLFGQKEFIQFFAKKPHHFGCGNCVLRQPEIPSSSSCFLLKKLDFSQIVPPKNGRTKNLAEIFGEIHKALQSIIRLQLEILESKPRGGTPCREK